VLSIPIFIKFSCFLGDPEILGPTMMTIFQKPEDFLILGATVAMKKLKKILSRGGISNVEDGMSLDNILPKSIPGKDFSAQMNHESYMNTYASFSCISVSFKNLVQRKIFTKPMRISSQEEILVVKEIIQSPQKT